MGYDVFMVLIYVSPMTSLIRNAERGRSLPTSAVLKSWANVMNNIGPYKQLFGNNIVVINNDPADANKSFDSEEIQKMFPNPKGKEKSPEDLAKSKAEKEAVNQQIQSLLQKEPEFDSMETAKSKVNEFVRQITYTTYFRARRTKHCSSTWRFQTTYSRSFCLS